jgi:hypothetical protein
VIEDKPLARSLYDAVQVDQMIPAEFYRAVAQIHEVLALGEHDRRRPLGGLVAERDREVGRVGDDHASR